VAALFYTGFELSKPMVKAKPHSGYVDIIPVERHSMRYRALAKTPTVKKQILDLAKERGELVLYECGIGKELVQSAAGKPGDKDKIGTLEFASEVGAHLFKRIILQDANPEVVEKIKQDIDQHYPLLKDKVEIRHAILKAGEKPEADVVLSHAVLEHMTFPQAKVEHVQSLVNKTKPGGLLYLDKWADEPEVLEDLAKRVELPKEIKQITEIGEIRPDPESNNKYQQDNVFFVHKKNNPPVKKLSLV